MATGVLRRVYAVVDPDTYAGFCEMARAEGITSAEGHVDVGAALAGLVTAYATGRIRIAKSAGPTREQHAKPTGVDYREAVGKHNA